MTVRPVRWLALFCAAAIAMVALSVRAESPQELARTAFEQGVAASQSQRWEEARAQFERSLALVPKPSTQFNLAVADIKLGRGRDALGMLDAFERAATRSEHGSLLDRVPALRKQAEALLQSERATAEHGGNALGPQVEGLSERSRQDLAAGREYYARGRDREALAAFERAHDDSRRPELLYDIGVVADRLREDERAVRAYEGFLAALPDAPEAAVAERRVEALRSALSTRVSPVAPTRASALAAPAPFERDEGPRAPPDLRGSRALVTLGPALAAGSVGTLMWFLERSDAYDACESKGCFNPGTIDRQRRAALATTIVLGAAGLALTSVGATQLIHRKRAASRGRLSLDTGFVWLGSRADPRAATARAFSASVALTGLF